MAFSLQKFLVKTAFYGGTRFRHAPTVGKKAWKSFYFGVYFFCSAGPYEIPGHKKVKVLFCVGNVLT